jgi:hypothetical protein
MSVGFLWFTKQVSAAVKALALGLGKDKKN